MLVLENISNSKPLCSLVYTLLFLNTSIKCRKKNQLSNILKHQLLMCSFEQTEEVVEISFTSQIHLSFTAFTKRSSFNNISVKWQQRFTSDTSIEQSDLSFYGLFLHLSKHLT